MQHQCVGLDCYPYTAGSTMIRSDRGMLDARVLIASSEPHPECAGKDLDAIARQWGVTKTAAAEQLMPGSAIYFMMDEDDVQRVLAFDETMLGTRKTCHQTGGQIAGLHRWHEAPANVLP